jgi:hypothetical protein
VIQTHILVCSNSSSYCIRVYMHSLINAYVLYTYLNNCVYINFRTMNSHSCMQHQQQQVQQESYSCSLHTCTCHHRMRPLGSTHSTFSDRHSFYTYIAASYRYHNGSFISVRLCTQHHKTDRSCKDTPVKLD